MVIGKMPLKEKFSSDGLFIFGILNDLITIFPIHVYKLTICVVV